MIHPRRIWALPALALALVLAACSTPEGLNAPTLEAQFGSADEDRGLDVAFVSTGRIYSLSEQFGSTYADNGDGTSYESGSYEKFLLRRYDSNGKVTWTREIDSESCEGDPDSWEYYYYCSYISALSLATDSKGYVYALTSRGETYYDGGYDPEFVDYTVHKYDAAGNYINGIDVSNTIFGPTGGPDSYKVEFAVDAGGNIYVVGVRCEAERGDEEYGYPVTGGDCTNIIAKHSASGALQWQRTSTVGTPYGITVSSSGSVYVVGTTGLARYTNSGGLTWSKPASNSKGILTDAGNIVISGSSIYTRSGKDIRKYDSSGKQLWLRTQSGLNTLVLKDVTGDSSGNIYISGKYQASTSNTDAFVRKVSPSGSILWTKPFGTSAYDEARDAATITGSEIYVTGETQGSLAHTNIGGRDGYLRKLNSSGTAVWTR